MLSGRLARVQRKRMSIPLGLKITFSRNMVAVRVPDGWVLLNPVRLSEGAEAEVLAKAPPRVSARSRPIHRALTTA